MTPDQAHDLQGADVFVTQLKAGALLADRAHEADKRLIEPLLTAGKTPVIPSVPGRSLKRAYDRDLYKERHLIEKFFCRLKQVRAIATPHDERAANFLEGIYAASCFILLS